jgi:pimeloyl-ACP methyl ester carboxylesterase
MVDGMGAPAFVPTMLRLMPKAWKALTAVAPTLPYDAAILRGYQEGHPLPAGQWASVTMPSLVMCGASKETPEFLVHAAQAVAAALPGARMVQRRGLGHTKALNAPVIADTLTEFLLGRSDTCQTGDHHA